MDLDTVLKSGFDVRKTLEKGLNILIGEMLNAVSSLPEDSVLKTEHSEFGIPSVFSWAGIKELRTSEIRDLFSKTIEVGAEGSLDAGLKASMAYEITASLSGGILPDFLITDCGHDLIDGTVPGIALFIGEPDDNSFNEINICSKKGLKIVLAGKYSDLNVENEVLKLNGTQSLGINGLLARAAILYGNVEPGDRVSVAKYLKKRPKLITIHTGRLTVLDVLTIFSAAAAGSYSVVNSVFPEIPRFSERASNNMVLTGMAERGITIKTDKKIRSGSTFENQRIRKTDAFFEFGGDDATESYEIVTVSDVAEDGAVFVDGENLQNLSKGDYPLSIEIRVNGSVEPVMEQAIERRVHFALNRMEGVWHNGQRDTCWIRISDLAVEKGITFDDLGDSIISDIRNNFGSVIDAVDITFSTNSAYVSDSLKKAKEHYSSRDKKLMNLTDEDVNEFYTCTVCQTYAPGHICIITPERPSVCGSVTWIDAKVGSEINPGGRQRPFPKGVCIDSEKGIWSGINDIVSDASMGSVTRVCVHSIADSPMTACSCMEVVAAVSEDRRSILLIDRSETGDNPSGKTYSEISSMVGRGSQHPGYMGMGRHYVLSPGFLRGDGGLQRVSWISHRLKSMLGESLKRACDVTGDPGLYDKIADGNSVTDSNSLLLWLSEKNHPSLKMEPLKL